MVTLRVNQRLSFAELVVCGDNPSNGNYYSGKQSSFCVGYGFTDAVRGHRSGPFMQGYREWRSFT